MPTVAIAGTGPAGLMAAHVAAEAGLRVRVFEKRAAPGRKLLIAGSSGLNITYDCPLEEFVSFYSPRERMQPIIEAFPPEAWLRFIEGLGVKTFQGTSRRWFVEGMKAPPLLGAWIHALERRGVEMLYNKECVGFDRRGPGVRLLFGDGTQAQADAAALCLGGASWEKGESRIPHLFRAHGLAFVDFRSSNAGFKVSWPPGLLAEAEGKPIKNVVLRSARGSRKGDLVVTAYGVEGTPVYAVGEVGLVHLDLKPDLTVEQVRSRLASPRENLSPMRRVKRCLGLCDGAIALFYHTAPRDALSDLDSLAACVKSLPLELLSRQPLEEAISSAGGLSWDEVDADMMLRGFPGLFVAGEMIDWDAPTGGFLVQGCASTGYVAGRGIVRYLEDHPRITPSQVQVRGD